MTGKNPRAGAQQIAAELRADIESGVIAAGEKLPSTRALVERYGVTKETVRQAIAQLKAAGVVTTRQGSAVRAAIPPPMKRAGMARYSKSKWMNGIPAFAVDREESGQEWNYTDQVAEVNPDFKADAEIADALSLEVGARVIERRRTVRLRDTVTHILTSYYRPEHVEGTPIMTAGPGTAGGAGGGYAVLTERGLEPHDCREDLWVAMPTAAELDALQCRPTEPIAHLQRWVWTADGTIIEFARGPHIARYFRWSYTFTIPK